MTSPAFRLSLPADYPRIKLVESFEELMETPWEGDVNALCWERTLSGDFREIIEKLGPGEGIVSIDEDRLLGLSLSPAGETAREIALEDQRRLRAFELEPNLDCIYSTKRDHRDSPILTDVYSFHADSATVPADTILCSYAGATSEGLRNDEAQLWVKRPEIRAQLLAEYGGADDAGFLEYLNENFYDLHYAPLPHACPFQFGQGNLWRIALAYPDCPVPPCIHRAPLLTAGDPARLLLIS